MRAYKRTPGRPKAIYGLARSAQMLGDNQWAPKEYAKFLQLWNKADPSLPEIAAAKRFLHQLIGEGTKLAPFLQQGTREYTG